MKKSMITVLLCLLASIILPSCEKEVTNYMQLFYNESLGLKEVGSDSVKAFSAKVNNYVNTFPEEKENYYYYLIMDNIDAATVYFIIDVDDEWVGEDSIRF